MIEGLEAGDICAITRSLNHQSLNSRTYFCRKTIRPFVQSYGEIWTFTRSPGRMRMKCLRIFPETMPRISLSEPSSLSLNMALGNAWDTVASTSIGSDLATITVSGDNGGRVKR